MSEAGRFIHREDGIAYSGYRKFLDFVQKSQVSAVNAKLRQNHDMHLFKSAPLFTTKVHAFAEQHIDIRSTDAKCTYPQYGLLGSVIDDSEESPTLQRLVLSNTSEPWSAFICGSQGSGKSYTLSCLLENALLQQSAISSNQCPATGIVFHYDEFSSVTSGQVCEAAYLCSAGVPVTVLVCPTSLGTMKRRYENLLDPCDRSAQLQVRPFYLKDDQLSTETMMTLMAVDDVGERTPLYITSIRQLLRQMVLDKPNNPVFDYEDFLKRLDQLPLTKDQLSPLRLRLDLLKSVLVNNKSNSGLKAVYDKIWQPEAGSLTIVDLSDPFVTESDACALFSISLKLFIGGWQSAPRVIALDEAHKFLRSSTEAQKLTSDLISVIRQQRHLGSRVLIATQEPTVSGELLAFCNASIVHRFTSPQWHNTLRQHLIAAHRNQDGQSLLCDIAGLETGQAMVFCPTAILDVDPETGAPKVLRDAYFKLAIRGRLSADGGESILPAGHISSTKKPCSKENASRPYSGKSDCKLLGVSITEMQDADSEVDAGDFIQTVADRKCFSSTLLSKTTRDASSPQDSVSSTLASKSCDDGASIHEDSTESPIAVAYQTRCLTELELERIIYKHIKLQLGPSPVKDPWPIVVSSAIKELEKACGVPERYFADNELGDDCKDRRAIDTVKRLLKQYYDELQVPRDRRAAKKWLRD